MEKEKAKLFKPKNENSFNAATLEWCKKYKQTNSDRITCNINVDMNISQVPNGDYSY